MSSYSKFDRNCHRDAIIIAVANCATSIFCGVVVFSALGFIAHDKGVEIEEVKPLRSVLNQNLEHHQSFGIFRSCEADPASPSSSTPRC